jgi:hypothetical protein
MSHNTDSAVKMAEEGPIDMCLSFMAEALTEGDIQADCLTALSAMSRADRNAEAMSAGAFKGISQGFQHHSANHKWLQACFTFLGNCCVAPKAAENVVDTTVISKVLAVLRKLLSEQPLLLRGLRCLENVAYGPERVKDHMKREGIETYMKEISDASSAHEVKVACRAVLDALTRRVTGLSTGVAVKKTPGLSLKERLGEASSAPITELTQDVKNFLLAGQIVSKHGSGEGKPKHVYISQDFKYLVWKDLKKAVVDDKCRMKLYKLRTVEKDRCTSTLQKKTMTGKFIVKEECAFAIIGRDKTLDLETKTQAERDRWYDCMKMLVEWKNNQKAVSTKFEQRD